MEELPHSLAVFQFSFLKDRIICIRNITRETCKAL